MLRGWNEEFLTLSIEVDADDTSPVKPAQRIIAAAFEMGGKGPADIWLMEAAGWTWRVQLPTSLSLDLTRELRARAEEEARSEQRRAGKEGVRTSRSRMAPDHQQKKTIRK